MKLAYIDLETTGLLPWKHTIVDMAILICDAADSNSEFEFFHQQVQPELDKEVDPKALIANNLTQQQIMGFTPIREARNNLLAFMNKHVNPRDKQDKLAFVGYNSSAFDMPFMRAWWTRCVDKWSGSYFYSTSIDVMCIALEHLVHKRCNMPDFKLKTVALELGLEVQEDQLHGALYDAAMTAKIHRRIIAERRLLNAQPPVEMPDGPVMIPNTPLPERLKQETSS